MFKDNNKDTRTTPMASFWCRQWHRSGVFIVNFEHISHLALVFLLLTCNGWLCINATRFCTRVRNLFFRKIIRNEKLFQSLLWIFSTLLKTCQQIIRVGWLQLNKNLLTESDDISLREKYPNTELFWSLFFCIRIRNNSIFENFSRSVWYVLINSFMTEGVI